MDGSDERRAADGGAEEPPARERPELATRILRAVLAYPAALFAGIGDLTLMALRMLGWMVRPPYRLRLLLQSMAFIGVGSLFIITLTALTSGMVLALQGVYSMRVFNAEGAVGGAVAMSLTREISPVFTALMVTARASSAIATELGTMRVTDQIDALATMGVNPIQYLVVPRVLAGAMMTPVLCLLFTFIGMVGCYFVAVIGLGVDPGQFMDKVGRWIGPADFRQSVIKATVFGAMTILIACQQGYSAKGGAAGVGQATTRAVVIGSVLVMITDYFLTAAML
ncbi:MAG: ABC transporter permease [Deltaproteobacteria bacterium]|nr:ABC transporter permease [Deltaproteobacteria bacterium]